MRDTILLFRSTDHTPEFGLLLTADFREECGRWLAECFETGTAAYASTLEEAREELADAITLQLDEVERLGFIQCFLDERGIRPVRIVTRRRNRRTSGATWSLAKPSPIDLVPA